MKKILIELALPHNLNLAAQYAHHIVLLKVGRLWAEGSPDVVLTEASIESRFEYRCNASPIRRRDDRYCLQLDAERG